MNLGNLVYANMWCTNKNGKVSEYNIDTEEKMRKIIGGDFELHEVTDRIGIRYIVATRTDTVDASRNECHHFFTLNGKPIKFYGKVLYGNVAPFTPQRLNDKIYSSVLVVNEY